MIDFWKPIPLPPSLIKGRGVRKRGAGAPLRHPIRLISSKERGKGSRQGSD